jgi:hypothetical protein
MDIDRNCSFSSWLSDSLSRTVSSGLWISPTLQNPLFPVRYRVGSHYCALSAPSVYSFSAASGVIGTASCVDSTVGRVVNRKGRRKVSSSFLNNCSICTRYLTQNAYNRFHPTKTELPASVSPTPSPCMVLFYRYYSANNLDFSRPGFSVDAGWWNEPLIKNWASTAAYTVIFDRLDIIWDKCTHMRKSGTEYASAIGGLTADLISLMSKHTLGGNKLVL